MPLKIMSGPFSFCDFSDTSSCFYFSLTTKADEVSEDSSDFIWSSENFSIKFEFKLFNLCF